MALTDKQASILRWFLVIMGILLVIGLIIYALATTCTKEGGNCDHDGTCCKGLDCINGKCTSGLPPPVRDVNKIQAYLQSVYPTSDKIKSLSSQEAADYYQKLWFYYLVADWLGAPSTTKSASGKSIVIKGTLMPLSNLVPIEFADGAPFFHPSSVVIKDLNKVFYPSSGKAGASSAGALKAVSTGKYIEVSSFGWCAYPNGIYLNSAIGSGIFWTPGKIAAGPK